MTRVPLVLVTVPLCLVALTVPVSAKPPTPSAALEPTTFAACGTTVTLTQDVNKIRERVQEGPDGTVIEARGRFVGRITTVDGRTATFNASGPATITIGADGTRVVFAAKGQTFLYATTAVELAISREAGLPQLALTSGPVVSDTVVDPGTGEILSGRITQRPPRAVDVCSLLR